MKQERKIITDGRTPLHAFGQRRPINRHGPLVFAVFPPSPRRRRSDRYFRAVHRCNRTLFRHIELAASVLRRSSLPFFLDNRVRARSESHCPESIALKMSPFPGPTRFRNTLLEHASGIRLLEHASGTRFRNTVI